MLNVVLSSLSKNRASAFIAAVLDSYATRLNENTWSTQIAPEGLSALRAELNLLSAHGMAVSCVSMNGAGSQLEWIAGLRYRFDQHGAYCAVGTGFTKPSPRPFDATVQILQLGTTAAYRHDIGKANLFMAQKLSSNHHEPDPVRHDILSALIADELRNDPRSAFGVLFDRAAKTAKSLTPDTRFFDFPRNTEEMHRWLIATHHRLPFGLAGCATFENHINESHSRSLRSNLTCAGDLFADTRLTERLALPFVNPVPYGTNAAIEGMFLWSRLALMSGDHHASATALPEGVTGILANSAKPNRPAQDLAQHLLATGRFTEKAARILPNFESRLPALYPEDRREISRPSPVKPGINFSWQNKAALAARQIANAKDADKSGTFIVLCASTGSGKTRAGAKIMSALSGDRLRLSVLLGLRSLTLQTGDSYADEARIPRESLAILIGSREVRNLHTAEKKKRSTQSGSEISYVEANVVNGVGVRLPAVIETQIQRDDDRRMLCSPVLVCTIDYLMGGADWSRAHHILPQLRLMTSDVILDEIDGYNLEDYPAIGRLCYLVGFFGRRLMLSSATAMPEIVSPLYKAYEAGWRAYASTAGANQEINTLFVADSVAPSLCRASAQEETNTNKHWFKPRYQDFTEQVARAARASMPLRRGKTVDITNVEDLLASIADLHTHNHVKSTSTPGVDVSCGLIRVARVTDCVAVSRAIVRMGTKLLKEYGIFVQVLPYHANLPTAVRAWVESTLDDVLKRKVPAADPVSHHPIAALARNKGVKHATLLVVATPVEEVGRDHDFDWGIIEPSSSRSIVQCAGRINRHRRAPLNEGHTNLVVFQHNLRDQEGRERSFWGPGFEPKTKPFPSHDIAEIAPNLVDRPDAEACLADDITDNLPLWERDIIADTLEASITASFVQPLSAKLTDEHFRLHGFRNDSVNTDVYYSIPDKYWKDSETGSQLTFDHATIFPEDYWLVDMKNGLGQIASDIAFRLGMDHHDEEFSKKYMRVGLAEYYYDNLGRTLTHPLVGVFKENPKSILK